MDLIREGNTMEEVVQLVLLENGWTTDDVDIVTISEEKGSWFKKAKVVVKFIEKKKEEESSSKTVWSCEECSEWIFFMNHKLTVLADFPYQSILVHPSPTRKVWIGNRPILMPEMMLNDGATIHEKLLDLEELLDIHISSDLLQATVCFRNDTGYRPKPYAKLMHNVLHIYFEEIRIPVDTWDVDRILGLLLQKNILIGHRPDMIKKWLKDPSKWSEGVVAAEGRPMFPGRNTEFKMVVDSSKNQRIASTGSKETVKHHGFIDLRTVHAGQMIMEVLPRTFGVAGTNLKGENIPAVDGIDEKLALGKNIIAPGDQRYILATCDGLVEYVHPAISVTPLYVINGDVDLKTGSIKFNGSVIVKGNVREGMTVEAAEHIQVMGIVTESTLIAGKSIEVRGNVVMSTLTSGISQQPAVRRWLWIRQMNDQIIQIINDRTNHTSKASMEQRQHFLLKWKDEGNAEWFLNHPFTWDDRINRWAQFCYKMCNGYSAGVANDEQLIEEGLQLESLMYDQIYENYNINVYNSHMSNLYSSGNVAFVGKGCYLSFVCAPLEFIATEGEGYIRGGHIFAGIGIKAKTIGSPAGAATHCVVSNRTGNIDIEHLHPGLHASIGRSRKIFNDQFLHCRVHFQSHTKQLELVSSE